MASRIAPGAHAAAAAFFFPFLCLQFVAGVFCGPRWSVELQPPYPFPGGRKEDPWAREKCVSAESAAFRKSYPKLC